MKRKRKEARHHPAEPPTYPPPVLSDAIHDEVTAVDMPGAIKLASGQVKPRVLCCKGAGFITWEGGESCEFAYFCWCPAGKRMQSAVHEQDWPISIARAEATAQRIGLRRVA
jgi:hypothetical protein